MLDALVGIASSAASAARVCTGAAELEPGAVYLSPSGRRCRWCPTEATEKTSDSSALFLYDLRNGQPASGERSDGFRLERANWHFLRQVTR